MEYQNKLSRLRHAFLRLQGQDLTQVLLRAAAKKAEFIAENVYTTEEIFRAITDKIYKETNELSWATKFELVSDAESLAILKKELIEDVAQEFQWEETLFILLEGLDDKQKILVKALLNNQYHIYLDSVNDAGLAARSGGFHKLMVPIVRRIFGNFTAQKLVGVQPMTGPVGLAYSLQYRVKDDETGEYVDIGDASYEHEDYNKKDTVVSMGAIDLTGTAGRKMMLDVVTHPVEAHSRKLQAGWTIEAMQDLNAMYGLDIEAEMVAALAQEVTHEINAEIIGDLKEIAGEAEIAELNGDIENQLIQLSIKINQQANEIARKTRRGAGNYVIVSPEVAKAFSESEITPFEPAETSAVVSDLMEIGTLNKCIKIFSSIDVPTDEVLVGYKGRSGETDTGYFYCPYIPLMSSGVVVNPVTFQPIVSLMTRYGKKTTKNVKAYYSNIKLESKLFAVKEEVKENDEDNSS